VCRTVIANPPDLRRFVRAWRWKMLDVIYLIAGLGFFAAAILYLIACDRL
jgi:hypothetical protein